MAGWDWTIRRNFWFSVILPGMGADRIPAPSSSREGCFGTLNIAYKQTCGALRGWGKSHLDTATSRLYRSLRRGSQTTCLLD